MENFLSLLLGEIDQKYSLYFFYCIFYIGNGKKMNKNLGIENLEFEEMF